MSKSNQEIQDEFDNLSAFRPDWECSCSNCDAIPTVGELGLCGPCTWGEADTMNGAWWDDKDEARYEELRLLVEAMK